MNIFFKKDYKSFGRTKNFTIFVLLMWLSNQYYQQVVRILLNKLTANDWVNRSGLITSILGMK